MANKRRCVDHPLHTGWPLPPTDPDALAGVWTRAGASCALALSCAIVGKKAAATAAS